MGYMSRFTFGTTRDGDSVPLGLPLAPPLVSTWCPPRIRLAPPSSPIGIPSFCSALVMSSWYRQAQSTTTKESPSVARRKCFFFQAARRFLMILHNQVCGKPLHCCKCLVACVQCPVFQFWHKLRPKRRPCNETRSPSRTLRVGHALWSGASGRTSKLLAASQTLSWLSF